jgi:hypothetical protein
MFSNESKAVISTLVGTVLVLSGLLIMYNTNFVTLGVSVMMVGGFVAMMSLGVMEALLSRR